MEPVTHILTGACLARTGLNRRAAYATLTMAVAAEFPDIDTLWSLGGPVVGFQHHRGITHTFLGIPLEAALVVGGVYGLHCWRLRRAARAAAKGAPHSRTLTAAPVRWGLLYGFALLALLSHLWLDYTNNYGVRPFFPFNPRWYAASFTFIFDPLMFVLLLAAIVLPPLFRLVGAEVGARRQPFPARGWSITALLAVAGLWGWRAVAHSRAVSLAMAQSVADPASVPVSGGPAYGILGGSEQSAQPAQPVPAQALHYLAPQRVLASPDPIDPRHWYTVSDFGPFYQLASIALETDSITASNSQLQPKPQPTPEERIAERSLLGRVYLDWSPMPFLDHIKAGGDGSVSDPDNQDRELPAGTAVVTFRDPRFLGEVPWLHLTRTPLTGTVVIDPQGAVLRQTMDGKAQR